MNIQDRLGEALLRCLHLRERNMNTMSGEDSHLEADYEDRNGYPEEAPDDDPHWRDDEGEFDEDSD